jgi:hypothetical protein
MASILSRACGCSGTPASPVQNCKNVVVSIPPKLSDAAIYSQTQQLSLGIPPDWNSPDITTNNDIPFTLYTAIQVTVHNLSNSVPAINVLVHAYTSAFGIGLPQTYLSTQVVNIAPSGSVNLSFPLPQNILNAGPQIGFFIELEHAYDLTQINNSGCQVISGHDTAAFGRNYVVPIPVCNNSSNNMQMKFAIMPNNVVASISPTTYSFSPYEQITASLSIIVPAALTGSSGNVNIQEVSVMAQAVPSGQLIGGATEVIFINN